MATRKSKTEGGGEVKLTSALCLCGCGEATAKGRAFKQGHDARLRGRIRRGEVELTGAIGEFAKRHGIEPAPKAEPKAKPKPKAQAKPRVRKPRTPKVQAEAAAVA